MCIVSDSSSPGFFSKSCLVWFFVFVFWGFLVVLFFFLNDILSYCGYKRNLETHPLPFQAAHESIKNVLVQTDPESQKGTVHWHCRGSQTAGTTAAGFESGRSSSQVTPYRNGLNHFLCRNRQEQLWRFLSASVLVLFFSFCFLLLLTEYFIMVS